MIQVRKSVQSYHKHNNCVWLELHDLYIIMQRLAQLNDVLESYYTSQNGISYLNSLKACQGI